jgi:hypothetical protein
MHMCTISKNNPKNPKVLNEAAYLPSRVVTNEARRSPKEAPPCRSGYAANSKAAISTAADLRATLAAGAMGAS